jgi:DNA-binding MarR family transcriptional regulator
LTISSGCLTCCHDERVSTDDWNTATAVLRLATELVDGIQQGLANRSFTDVRPVHGFAFARLAGAPATTAQLAEHLGITKQATSELVEHLVQSGYLIRAPDPDDRRARLLVLTDRGHACTRAAQEAAGDVVERWDTKLTREQQLSLRSTLAAISGTGRLRPAW